ncbi:MAG: hypothetical protein ACK4NY_03870 [Spirosomataceae bacterium]
MKKSFILLLFIVNLAHGQSVTITPAASQTIIRKLGGTANLSVIGDGVGGFGMGTTGNSEISLSNMTYLGASATSSIKFNNVYSIKNTYTPNLAGEENTFGMFYNTTPFFAFNPYSTVLETVPISVSHTASNTLSLSNSTALGNNVKNEIFFKTGSYFTGAIKTIGTSASFARMGFFTYTDQSSNNLVERLSIIDGGNVGIGTTTPQTALHVVGNVRSSNLAGTGTRNVYADENGTLLTTSVTKYYSVPFSSFVKLSNDGTSANYTGGIASLNSGTTTLRCPLYLPHGSKLINARVYYFDNDVTNDLTFNFYRSPHSALTFFGMSAVTSTGNSSSIQFLDVNLGSAIVDNQTNFYYFSVSPKSGTTWSNSMGVVSVVITYE